MYLKKQKFKIKVMSRKEENIEALSEILSDYGVIATDEQIKGIAEDFDYHLDAMSDMYLNQHLGGKSECAECKRLKMEIDELREDIEIFKESVKTRTGARVVWTDKTRRNVRYDF